MQSTGVYVYHRTSGRSVRRRRRRAVLVVLTATLVMSRLLVVHQMTSDEACTTCEYVGFQQQQQQQQKVMSSPFASYIMSLFGWFVKPKYAWNSTAEFALPEYVPDGSTFSLGGNLTTCFAEGTEAPGTANSSTTSCRCRKDWFGGACSIPGIIERSRKLWPAEQLVLRDQPRRVVMAFPFNIEFDMLDLRFAELDDVVDVYLILESNYTAYGTLKPTHLLHRLLNGSYEDVAPKIVHVLLDFFPAYARKEGSIADALLRNHIGTNGLSRIKGLRSDDLFILNDADEIPRREVVQFLKWHDGYPEPVALTYRWSVYGFFWGMPALYGMVITEMPAVSTIGLLTHTMANKAFHLRSWTKFEMKHGFEISTYAKMHEGRRRVQMWSIGGLNEPAGWHCSWCLDADGIRAKLLSAQNGDFPRWGDYPEKTNISYIKQLVARGLWFDDRTVLKRFDVVSGPEFLMKNRRKYRSLLENQYLTELTAVTPTATASVTATPRPVAVANR